MLDKRPEVYDYFEQTKEHLGGNLDRVFDGTLIYPRQLEVHLPGDGKQICNFNCRHCQGRRLEQPLGKWEEDVLSLVEKLRGAVPYHIYGGAYTEPLINPYILDYIRLTKKYGNHFGIHTNGAWLLKLEKEQGFLTELNRISDSPLDYISVSLDAGSPEGHARVKRISGWFNEIIEGLRRASELRGERRFPSLRIVYLMNELNSDSKDIENIVNLANGMGMDSLRFSIPYDHYGKDFDRVRRYKRLVEQRFESPYRNLVSPFLTTNGARPFVFWMSPRYQDVDELNYERCIYSYFQITLAADGWVYKCSCTASPSFKFCRLGKVTDDLDDFNGMVIKNHNPNWRPSICFKHGARCNRPALQINQMWKEIIREMKL